MVFVLLAGQAAAATINVDAACTLEQAINSANADDAGDTNCEDGSGADTINITADITLTADLPAITSSITINGNNRSIDGANAHRAIKTTSGGIAVVINDLTLRRNKAVFNEKGGAIFWRTSSGSKATLTLNRVVVLDSSSHDQSSSQNGGALYCDNGNVTINRSSFGNNHGSTGGAIDIIQNCAVTINNSSFYGNRAEANGGAIYMTTTGSSLELNHVTITGNSAASNGGGLRVFRGTLKMRNSIIYGNTNNCQVATSNVTFTVKSNNIIGSGSTSNCSSGQSSADPLLAASPTGSPPYYALRAGSPAIDAATCISGITRDQRGVSRPQQGANCDIGAYEYVPPPPPRVRDSDGDGEYFPYIPPTATPATPPTSVPHTCLSLPGHISVYNITASTVCTRLDAAGVGNANVLALGFRDAVDVWGWVLPNTEICFDGDSGRFLFLDASTSPRAVIELDAVRKGDRVCATFHRAGTVAWVDGPPAPLATDPPPSYQALTGCMVRLTEMLNFRAAPNGEIQRVLPAFVTLTAVERTEGWFKVDYHGAKGWISAGYVEPQGTCG